MYSMNYQEENLEDGREKERERGGYKIKSYSHLLLESSLLVYLDNYSKRTNSNITALTITHLHI